MTATTWQPGDPLAPDNGCGAMVVPQMTESEREAVIAEGGPPPPWHRPVAPRPPLYAAHTCGPCGVRWNGEPTCWVCGADNEGNRP